MLTALNRLNQQKLIQSIKKKNTKILGFVFGQCTIENRLQGYDYMGWGCKLVINYKIKYRD